MKLIGPEDWCKFLEEKLHNKNIDATIICLNYGKGFNDYAKALVEETAKNRPVIVSSFHPFDELLQNPRVGTALQKAKFIPMQQSKASVISYLSSGP